MREQKANDNGFPVVGKQAKEQQIFPFEQLVEYDGATNKITINANLTINGNTNIGELDIDSGDAPKGQVLTANGQSGASWGFPSMERITDLNGNFRFVEGEINTTTKTPEGITKTYGKWSLSGSHLLVVFTFDIAAGTYSSSEIATFELPSWVYDKIAILFQTAVVDRKTIPAWDNTYSNQILTLTLSKLGDNKIQIGISGATINTNKKCRTTFDLLIDAS